MKNKTILILIAIGLLIVLFGIINLMFTSFQSGEVLFSSGFSLINFLGLILIFKNSTIRNTIYFNFILGFIAVIIVGAMFKILHWPGSAIMLSIGLFGITIVYSLRFIAKPKKVPLDVMKLLWMITSNITALCVFLHWLPKQITYIPNFLMLLITIYFALICLKYKELLER